MGAADMPAAEFDIDEGLVHALLADQHPDLVSLDLEELAHGWDNALYRLGDALTVRLPRRELAGPLIDHELRWLPELAPRLPLPVPAPVRRGRPALGYPWSWSIVPFLPGTVAALAPLGDAGEGAEILGRFVAALHEPAPADAPVNPYRGMRLSERDAGLRERVCQLGGLVDARAVLRCWDRSVAAPVWPGPPVWLHGDLHPANLLVSHGRLSAVIDFGDLTSGDPATDLSVAWMLFGPGERGRFRTAAGTVDDDTWRRARGNALAHAVACVANSADNPLVAGVGRHTLAAVLADEDR